MNLAEMKKLTRGDVLVAGPLMESMSYESVLLQVVSVSGTALLVIEFVATYFGVAIGRATITATDTGEGEWVWIG